MRRADMIAAVFSRLLREYLREDELARVLAWNADNRHAPHCATHDVCDPDEIMAEAFTECGVDCNTQNDLTRAEWETAWRVARVNDFDPDKVMEAAA